MYEKHIIYKYYRLIAFIFSACTNNLVQNAGNKEGTKTVTPVAVTSIVVSSESGTISLVKDDTKKIEAFALPVTAVNKKLSFVSDNPEIVSINSDGLMKAVSEGEAVITLSTANNVTKKIAVKVVPQPIAVTALRNDAPLPDFFEVDDTFKFNIKVEPSDATNKEYRFFSENNIVRIGGDGLLRAQKEGSTEITVTSVSNPEIKQTFSVTVKKRPEIKIPQEPIYYGTSNQGRRSFEVETLNGKLDYTPEIQGDVQWLSIDIDRSAGDKDIITLNFTENKTPWSRNAYIKFRDNKTNKYIPKAENRKWSDIVLKVTQEKNGNPPGVTLRWVHGINPPSEVERERIRYNGDQEAVAYAFNWHESTSTNFFNARKASYVQTDGSLNIHDSNMCWAKTSANMLHWWFEQNKDNIARYKQITGAADSGYDVSYDRFAVDFQESGKSSIARLFTEKFRNAGGDMFSGIKWYLYEQPQNYKPAAPALFKDVFNKDSGLIEQKSVHSKTEFETIIKNALNSEKAIGLAMRRDQSMYWHGITLWGAAFDGAGNIIAVYVSDSNDPRNLINTFGIHYQEHPKRGNPYIINFANNIVNKVEYIDTVITLDKGDEGFKKFFETHR